MADYSVNVMLKFPAMPEPYSVRLSPWQVHLLDRQAEWRFGPDGAVVYERAQAAKQVPDDRNMRGQVPSVAA